MGTFTIGQLAEATNVGVETVRYYEKRGLIEQPSRPVSGYRRYSEDVSERIKLIKRYQALGFTLKEIRDFLDLRDQNELDQAKAHQFCVQKIADIEQKIEALEQMRQVLVENINRCSRSST